VEALRVFLPRRGDHEHEGERQPDYHYSQCFLLSFEYCLRNP
jgi:hypothetical protein